MSEAMSSRLDNVEERLKDLEARFDERSKTLFNRTGELGVLATAISELTASTREMAVKLGTAERRLETMENKVDALEDIPGKRWQSATTTVVTALISGGVGYLLAQLLATAK